MGVNEENGGSAAAVWIKKQIIHMTEERKKAAPASVWGDGGVLESTSCSMERRVQAQAMMGELKQGQDWKSPGSTRASGPGLISTIVSWSPVGLPRILEIVFQDYHRSPR